MGLPPSLALAVHWTDIEAEDVAMTTPMVGAEGGTNGYVIWMARDEDIDT